MAYSKRRLFRRHSAKKRLSKRKTYRKRRTRRQRGRGVGFSTPVYGSDNSYESRDEALIRFTIADAMKNDELKQMIGEMPSGYYSGPARSAEEQERSKLQTRDYRKRKNELLLDWFQKQPQTPANDKVIQYLQNNTI